jgi:NADH-quinone oxidoreductase subunit E
MVYHPTKKIPANDPLNNPLQKEIIDQVIDAHRSIPGSTMVILNELQSKIGYISRAMQEYVAKKLVIPASQVHGVVSFYSFFTTKPRGRHTIKFCMGTACYVGGTPQLIEKAKQITGIEPGQTTEDLNITLEVCRCVGACSQAPVVIMGDEVHGRTRPNKLSQLVKAYTENKPVNG